MYRYLRFQNKTSLKCEIKEEKSKIFKIDKKTCKFSPSYKSNKSRNLESKISIQLTYYECIYMALT